MLNDSQSFLSKWITRIKNLKHQDFNFSSTELQDAIHTLSTSQNILEASFETYELYLLNNLLDLKDYTTEDIMVPTANIIALQQDTLISQSLQVFKNTGLARLPVYEETLDDAFGFLHIKDVAQYLLEQNSMPIKSLVRKIIYVSPSMRIFELLPELRQKKTPIALIIDEHGGIDGLITLKDIIRKMIGDLFDEHNQLNSPAIDIDANGNIKTQAKLSLEEFENFCKITFSEEEKEEADTLGGLILFHMGKFPQIGEIFIHKDTQIKFEVLSKNLRQLLLLKITLPDQN